METIVTRASSNGNKTICLALANSTFLRNSSLYITLNVAKKADTPLSGVSNLCPSGLVPKLSVEKSTPLASLQFVEEIEAPDIIIPLQIL